MVSHGSAKPSGKNRKEECGQEQGLDDQLRPAVNQHGFERRMNGAGTQAYGFSH
jgi:hypothetical protein